MKNWRKVITGLALRWENFKRQKCKTAEDAEIRRESG